jgi:nucleoside-diphosphate-sugar epimerase
MAKKVILTGSSGFLGSRLVKELQNEEIVAIPHKKILSTKLEPFDYFYFLSTYGNMAFHTDSEKILQANIGDLIYIINQAVKQKFKSFVFMSTSSVKLSTQSMYSRTKRAAEEILLAQLERTSLPFCVIRPYSITGVGEQPQHLIPTLIRSCLDNENMSFVSWPTHDFIDVDDVVSGILCLAEHKARGIYELGTGVKHTNLEVLRMVEKITGEKANINPVEQLRAYDNEDWQSTNYRARGYGWLPQKTLEQSIKEMVEDYVKQTRKKNS